MPSEVTTMILNLSIFLSKVNFLTHLPSFTSHSISLSPIPNGWPTKESNRLYYNFSICLSHFGHVRQKNAGRWKNNPQALKSVHFHSIENVFKYVKITNLIRRHVLCNNIHRWLRTEYAEAVKGKTVSPIQLTIIVHIKVLPSSPFPQYSPLIIFYHKKQNFI